MNQDQHQNENDRKAFLDRKDDALMTTSEEKKRQKALAKEKRAVARNAYNETHFWKKFSLKDCVFIIVASVAMLITCFDMPLLAQIDYFGLGFVGIAFQLAFFQAVIVTVVPKPGASFFSILILGAFHLFMAPWMSLFCLIAGLVSEAIALLIFHSYRSPAAVGFNAAVVPMLLLGLEIGFTFLRSNWGIAGYEDPMAKLHIQNWYVPVGIAIAVLALAVAGAVFGVWLTRRLIAKGVIKNVRLG